MAALFFDGFTPSAKFHIALSPCCFQFSDWHMRLRKNLSQRVKTLELGGMSAVEIPSKKLPVTSLQSPDNYGPISEPCVCSKSVHTYLPKAILNTCSCDNFSYYLWVE
jgi:hypothetical protein